MKPDSPCWVTVLMALGLILTFGGWERIGAAEHNPLEIRSVTVNGKEIPMAGKKILRLPPNPEVVSFVIGGSTNSGGQTLRIRHRLEGQDSQWRDGEVFMYVALRFFDTAGRQVSQVTFRAAGESTGWRGTVANSEFIHRRETVIVPPSASTVWAVISSAGPPTAVGLYIVADLAVSRISPTGGPPEVLVAPPASFHQAGEAPVAPADWMRDGLNADMAKIIELGSARAARAFGIQDEDPNAHAEWHTVKEFAKVTPGEQLLLDWDELYTMGQGTVRTVSYSKLAAGDYHFRIIETTVLGASTGAELSLPIVVPVPYWQSPWFWGAVVMLAVAAGAGAHRYVVWQQMQRQLARLESQRLLELERLRIAQDIHDDLGARVTQISLVSGLARNEPGLPVRTCADFDAISRMSRELVSALYETVWAVNPENDNLDALGNFICQMVDNLCEQAQLRRRLRVAELPREIHVPSHVRHNLCMAVKEAVHNAIKHAKATELQVQVELADPILTVSVKDDGCGFDPVRAGAGNGLSNMHHRLRQIGGTCAIQSQPGNGTAVRFRASVRARPA